MKKKIAYLVGIYPRECDPFIRIEVEKLRKLGYEVSTFSVRRPEQEHLISKAVLDEYNNTCYILDNIFLLFFAGAKSVLFTPLRMLAAVKLAWKTCSPGIKARLWQIAYLLEACFLAQRLKKSGIGHLHNHIGEASATVAMLTSTLSGIPVSHTIHGPGIFYNPVHWALGTKIEESTFTVSISNFCKSQCMIFTPFRNWDKLHVIHCGIDDLFFSQPITPIEAVPRLLAVGRLCEHKGQPLLVEAAAILKKEGLEFEVVIVGDGPLRPRLENLINKLQVQDRVRLTGWIRLDGVREELTKSRALVVSSFAEGLPVVIMEAFALGRPVISTHIAGIPELVEDGVNGLLFPAGSVDELAKAMKKILNCDVKELEKMGLDGHARVKKDFNIDIEVKKLAELIDKWKS